MLYPEAECALALIKSMCYINPYKNMIAKKAIGQNNFLKLPKTGEIVEGKVIGNGKACVFLDLGNMGAGIIYGKEFYEAKEKLRQINLGKIMSDEVKKKISNSLKGNQNAKGYKHTEEALIKMQESKKGGNSNKGSKWSEEAKKRIREAVIK